MKLKLVKEKEKIILERLLQLYLHDISLSFQIDFDSENGLYIYDGLDKYFDSSKNEAYFIKNDKNILGFILIDEDENGKIIQEMFILNHYKNKGYGKEAVYSILNMNKCKWTIKSLPCSLSAERFWNKTIKEYTKDNYCATHIGKYNRAVFTFDNSNNQ